MSWVTSRNDYHTSKNTAGCSCHRAAKRQDTTWLNIMLTINSAYIIEINVLVERNVSVFVVAILATIRWTGLNHSNCRLKAGGNFKDLVGGLWWSTLYPPRATRNSGNKDGGGEWNTWPEPPDLIGFWCLLAIAIKSTSGSLLETQ